MAPPKPRVGRVWQGRTTFANAHAYQEHLRKETLPGPQAIDGFEQALVLRRLAGDDAVEFLVLTLWSSQDESTPSPAKTQNAQSSRPQRRKCSPSGTSAVWLRHLYALVFLSIGSRRIEYLACTSKPNTAWVPLKCPAAAEQWLGGSR